MPSTWTSPAGRPGRRRGQRSVGCRRSASSRNGSETVGPISTS